MLIDMNPHLNQISNRRGLSMMNPLLKNPTRQIQPTAASDSQY
jgi:hypothetical protein